MTSIIAFDFKTKQLHENYQIHEVKSVIEQGYYLWLDLTPHDLSDCIELLESLNIDVSALEPNEECEWLSYFDHYLEFTLRETTDELSEQVAKIVQVILAENVMVTIDFYGAVFMQKMRLSYRDDFIKVAKTPGFLLFELADHLISQFHKTLRVLVAHNKLLQKKMFEEVEETVFNEASIMINDLLNFRRILLGTDEIFDELSTRKCSLIAETAQTGLHIKSSRLEILSRELLNERDSLTSSLNLYLGMMSYRTSKIMHRLTGFSIIFLPLGFLVGLYGMNFSFMPELKWDHGYLYFWGLVGLVFVILFVLGRRGRWWH